MTPPSGYKGLEFAGEVWAGKVNLGEASTLFIFIDKNRVRCGQTRRVTSQGDEEEPAAKNEVRKVEESQRHVASQKLRRKRVPLEGQG